MVNNEMREAIERNLKLGRACNVSGQGTSAIPLLSGVRQTSARADLLPDDYTP
jgi:hypothetical protein